MSKPRSGCECGVLKAKEAAALMSKPRERLRMRGAAKLKRRQPRKV